MIEVPCPTCKVKIPYSTDNSFRPFCSDRCKLIDLGQWADEKFKVQCQDGNQESNQEKNFSNVNISEDDES